MKNKPWKIIALTLGLTMAIAGCQSDTVSDATEVVDDSNASTDQETTDNDSNTSDSGEEGASDANVEETANQSEGDNAGAYVSMLDVTDQFTDRDLEQTVDLSEAESISLVSGQDVTITEEGIYVLSGSVEETTIIVEADDDDAKVQLVLDNVSIINTSRPAIYVKSGDKIYVTSTGDENVLEVTGTFEADGDTNTDAVIFSKSDLVLNGTGTLTLTSAEGNGVTSKDDMKITGGTYVLTSAEDTLEAHDSIRIYDGDITIDSGKDGLHSEDDDDLSVGYIYIAGGTLNITAADDGIQGTTVVQIDGGTINIPTATEGIESTYIQINGGVIDLYATDDGINASEKSDQYDIMIEVNGGSVTVEVGSGDTDGFDSNGDIVINGGTINVTGNSSFDSDGSATINGGTVTVNGEVVTEIVESMMGPGHGGQGGPGGQGGNGQFPDGEMPEGGPRGDGQFPDGERPEPGDWDGGQPQGNPQDMPQDMPQETEQESQAATDSI